MNEWVGVLNDGFVGMVCCAFLGCDGYRNWKRGRSWEIEYVFFFFLFSILQSVSSLGHRRCIRRR